MSDDEASVKETFTDALNGMVPTVFSAPPSIEKLEFAGMLISLYRMPPTMGYVVTGFLLFRFFDIVKPRPIQNLEKLKGSLGIMSDDLVAGVYANMALQVVYVFSLLCR